MGSTLSSYNSSNSTRLCRVQFSCCCAIFFPNLHSHPWPYILSHHQKGTFATHGRQWSLPAHFLHACYFTLLLNIHTYMYVHCRMSSLLLSKSTVYFPIVSLFVSKRSKQDTLGVLNANLRDIYVYICMEVRMSPLSVAWAPHYVKAAELGHSHFF